MASNADMLAQVLQRQGKILTDQERLVLNQDLLVTGTADDPNSFDINGTKVGPLGYYPVLDASGITRFMPCVARQTIVAFKAGESAAFDRLPNDLSKVGGQFGVYNGVMIPLSGDSKGRFWRGPAGIAAGLAEAGDIEKVVLGTEDVATVSATSANGSVSICGSVDSSKGNGNSGLGLVGIALNKGTGASYSSVWAGYYEARRYPGANVTQGVESNVLNGGDTVDIDPYVPFKDGLTSCYWASSGRQEVPDFCHPASVAIGVINNGGTFRKGMIFAVNALDPNGRQEAIAFANQHILSWSSGIYQTQAATIVSTIGSQKQDWSIFTSVQDGGYHIDMTRGGIIGQGDTPENANIGALRFYDVRNGGQRYLVAADTVVKYGPGCARYVDVMSTGGAMCRWMYRDNAFFNTSYGSLGAPNTPWGNSYFLVPSTIVSDARMKHVLGPIPDDVVEAVGTVALVHYQMLDAIAEKGEAAARLHDGVIVQALVAEFEARGIDWTRHSMIGEDPVYEFVPIEEDVLVPVTETTTTTQLVVEEIDGRMVRHEKPVTNTVELVDDVPVFLADGSPAMTDEVKPQYVPVMAAVMEDGVPVYEPALDTAERPMLDATGETIVKPKMGPMLDDDGKPVMRLFREGKLAQPMTIQRPRTQLVRQVVRHEQRQKMEADGVTPMVRFALRYNYFLVVHAEWCRRQFSALAARVAALEASV